MKFLDIYMDCISDYLGAADPGLVRQKVFSGIDAENVRLDFFLGIEVISCGITSIFNLHRDLIYEMERALDQKTHWFKLDGYKFLEFRIDDEGYQVDLCRINGEKETHHIHSDDVLKNIVRCLRLTENVIDALRYVQPQTRD